MTYRITQQGKVLCEAKTQENLGKVLFWLWAKLEEQGFKATSYFLEDRGMVLASKPGRGTAKFIVREVK